MVIRNHRSFNWIWTKYGCECVIIITIRVNILMNSINE